jgi:hypothetical protein
MVPGNERVIEVRPSEARPPRFRESKEQEIVLSVDLGKMQDFSAYVISEIVPERRENKAGQECTVKTVNVRDIQRLPLGTSYGRIADHLYEVFHDQRLKLVDPKTKEFINATMLVDCGGVGEAVCDDMQRRLGLAFIRYRLVRGTAETRKARRNYSVPRTRMFEQLYASFTDDRVKIDPKLKLADALVEELRNLRPEANEETGYVRVVHREGQHDDLAITLAACNWWANRRRGRPLVAITDEKTYLRLMQPVWHGPQLDRHGRR